MTTTSRRAVAALALTLAVGGAGVASALPAQADPAPGCIYLNTSDNSREAYVRNTCDTTQRVKFKWQYARDGVCTSLAPNATHREDRNYPGRFAGVEAC